ncbi:hypothetical protein EJ05DRAFT_264432 [Pseudovirgaria hyperparasitica]|uniref:Uncharacterized protein n=1 Tax=Pseudovirgaria hyperparasitica TaxID=470096 RepID=A0A6A6WIG0_9PEZI|nr:uncharacterized protein EJ05DRAFT_264432 [Pseudovirgaria hyperparasitica]KAF2761447.1 hypothetical protein EJ05DRAFT_264432 [Pseudovirgaria hyperparasitica]
MPSHLRNQALFEPFSAEATRSHYITAPPQKKQKMSLTQTYYIASSARSKLGREAGKPDHNLRLLVGHANLLDSLMIELADAERDQEAWFNQNVNRAAKADEPKHIQWVDSIREEEDEDSDSDSEYDDSDYEMVAPLRRIPSPPVHITTVEYDDDSDSDEEFEDDEDDEEHALERVPSAHAMPELIHDDVSDDESPPTSPPASTREFSEQDRAALTTTSFYDKPAAIPASQQDSFAKDGFFVPQRSQPMIATF